MKFKTLVAGIVGFALGTVFVSPFTVQHHSVIMFGGCVAGWVCAYIICHK